MKSEKSYKYCCKPHWIWFKCIIWVIFFIFPRNTAPVFSLKQLSFQQRPEKSRSKQSVTALPSSHTSWVNDIQTNFGMKCVTGLSRHRDVIPKFNPAWDLPHFPLYKVSTLWTLRAPLTSALPVTHWFSTDQLSKFNSPSPDSCVLLPGACWKRQAFYSFTSRRHTWYDLPIELRSRQMDGVQDETRKE